MSWASPQDVRDRWLGSEKLPEDSVISKWLEDAETFIFAEFPDLPAQLTQDPDGMWRSRVVLVSAQLTIAALKNPDGIRQRSQTSGVFTSSETLGSETISSEFRLTAQHRSLLATRRRKHVGIDMTERRKPQSPLAGAWVNGPAGQEPGRK